MISLMVVDDDPIMVRAVSALVDASAVVALAGTATGADEAVALCMDRRPDVVLADVRMPGRDGISLAAQLTGGNRSARPRVLVTTAFAADDYLVRALGSGASGFIAKSAPWPEVERSVQVVHDGGIALPGDLTARLVAVLLPGTAHGGQLTRREEHVLQLVGAGRSPRQIAGDLVVSEATVRTHLDHLRAKLGVRTRVELALAARAAGLGYLVTGAAEPTDDATPAPAGPAGRAPAAGAAPTEEPPPSRAPGR